MSQPQWTGAWHPLAERFTMLTEDELRDMAASIAEVGQIVPCTVDPDGLGLDGRNRVAACALAGVEPRWETYDGDPVAFIIAANADRRHLSTGQRAMAVALGLADTGKRTNGRFRRGSVPDANGGSANNDWRHRVKQAGLVLDHAPELADPVLAGDLALDAAHKQADEIRKQRDRVAALGGELAKLVASGVIDLDEAERRHALEQRVAALPDDLAARVRSEALTIGEAETIVREREQRLDVWGEEVRRAIAVLATLAGHAVPPGLAERLDADEQSTLGLLLAGVPERDA